MAVIRYGGGSSAPRTAGRGVSRLAPATPVRQNAPRLGPMPQTPEDEAAGQEAAGGFTFNLDFGGGGSGGGGAGTSAAINTQYKLATDKATAKRNKKQAEYIRGLLSGTGYRSAIDELLGKVGEEENRQLTDVRNLYGTTGVDGAPGTGLRGDVQTRYQTATGQATAGYDALRNWLQNNAPQAFATATRATATPVSNALAAYQAAQGVSSAPVDAQIAAMNVAAGGGASNYNNLLDILRRAETTSQQSRLAEEGMARLATGNALTAGQTAALANLAAQQAQAEAGVRGQFGQTRLSAEQAAIQRRTTLEDALRALVGY